MIQPNGRRRRTHVFRIVLSHRRKAYRPRKFFVLGDTVRQYFFSNSRFGVANCPSCNTILGTESLQHCEYVMCQSDQHCIEECLNGHPDAFRHLIAKYEKPIMSYLVGRMGDNEAASEVAQESFVRAFFRLGTLKRRDSFPSWVIGIVHRVMLETFRRRQRERNLLEAGEPVAPATDGRMEHDSELAEAVAHLPAIYREVTVLRYYGGLSCAEVADRLRVPLGTVTKRLSRAYRLLREALTLPEDQRREAQR